MRQIFFFTLLGICFCCSSQARRYKELRFRDKKIQLSILPGISTNGLESGRYFNGISLNLLSGISAGTYFLEVGGISNLNTNSASGLQISGLANVIGSNSFLNMTLTEELEAIREGFSSNFYGVQFSGMLNFVKDSLRGVQFSGGFNVAKRDAQALQVAGISNVVGGAHQGIQVAGLSNFANRGTGGQISLLFNSSNEEVSVFQIAMINRSQTLYGKGSNPPVRARGIQFGLINFTKSTGGTQFGIINVASKAKGVQVGLINIFKPGPYHESGTGNTPIGLINLGTRGGHGRGSFDELFMTTFKFSTGSCYNCTTVDTKMPFDDRFKKMNQNSLIFSYNLQEDRTGVKWAAGYGFERVLYNKVSMIRSKRSENITKGNESKFISYGIDFLHVNKEEKFKEELSLLSKLHLNLGVRSSRSFYFFAGVSGNLYFHRDSKVSHRGFEIYSKNGRRADHQVWFGYVLGIHIHVV